MWDERKIKEEISELSSLQDLVRSYEEIASIRMKKTRDSVLKNRRFLKEIRVIFEEVRASYARQVKALASKRGKGRNQNVTFLSHNGKTVAVLLSANTGLYGDIIPRTFQKFMEEVKLGISEVTIVGKYGLFLLNSVAPNVPFTFFELPDFAFSRGEVDAIVRHIVQYEEIHVYFGEFQSVIKQEPNEFSISAEISLEKKGTENKISYIFEPSLEEILKFFETAIFASLFDQTISEGQLAKFASRFMAMEKSDENIRKSLSNLQIEKLRVSHSTLARKQLNSQIGVLALLN